MKVILSKEEIKTGKVFAEKRRQDSKAKGLTHSRNLKYISNDLDDYSVLAEIAAAKALSIKPILECGRYGQPDLVYHNVPIDVKFSFCKPSFAVAPSSFEKLPEKTNILYVTGSNAPANSESVELDVIGLISLKRCSGSMPLDDFGKPNRPAAYKVKTSDLTPVQKLIEYYNER